MKKMFAYVLTMLFVAAIAVPVSAINDDDPKKQKTESKTTSCCTKEKTTADTPCDKPCDKATTEKSGEKACCDKHDQANNNGKCAKTAAGGSATAANAE